jgi:hypothetical protein
VNGVEGDSNPKKKKEGKSSSISIVIVSVCSVFDSFVVPDDAALMNQQMAGGAQPQVPDMSKVFLSEKENLDLVKHEFSLDAIEAKLIGLKEKEHL